MASTLPELLTPQQAAEYLGVSVRTLAVWRCTGRYNLSYTKIGRQPYYTARELASFIERRTKNGHSNAT